MRRELAALPGVVTPRRLRWDAPFSPARKAHAGSPITASPSRCCCVRPAITPGAISCWWKSRRSRRRRLQACRASELLVIEYLDARGDDGNARKYRVMMIGGKIFPLHLAISRNWKVHYFTSDMADQARSPRRGNGVPRPTCRRARRQGDGRACGDLRALGLDYAGIDFGLNAKATSCCSRPTPPW